MNRSEADVLVLPSVEADSSAEPISLSPAPTTNPPSKPLSRRAFLMRSGYGIAGLLALSQWDGVGITPAEARAALPAAKLLAVSTPRLSLPFWSDGANWNDSSYWTTMQAGRRQAARTYTFCDLNGDGREELLIRGPGGIEVVQWHAENAQWTPLPGDATVLKEFKDDNFYDPEYGLTLGTGDIDGDGKNEIIGRFSDGLRVYKYDPTLQLWFKLPTCSRFGDDTGWGTQQSYYQTIQFGDVDGDKQDEVIARAGGGIIVWKFLNGSWSQIADCDRFPDNASWQFPQYWNTIQLADVDGDHAKELIARSGTGLEVWKLNTTTSIFEVKGVLNWDDPNHWDVPAQYTTIQCGDLDGDGHDEIFGNGIAGLEAFKFDIDAGTFTLMAPRMADTSIQYGWAEQSLYSTLQLADIDGDGAKEVIARAGSVGIMAFKLVAGKWVRFAETSVNAELSDANGWDEVQYYATFQSAHVLLPGDVDYTGNGIKAQAIVLGRSKTGVPTFRWTGSEWQQCLRTLPPFTGGQAAAYTALSPALGLSKDIRSRYNDLSLDRQLRMSQLYSPAPTRYEDTPATPSLPMPQGASFTANDWKAVCWQIYWELVWVEQVYTWFITNTQAFINDAFETQEFSLQLVGDKIGISGASASSIVFNSFAVIGNAAWAILGLPALNAGTLSAIAGMIGTAAGAAATFTPSDGTYSGAYSNLQEAMHRSFEDAKSGTLRNFVDVVGGTDANTGASLSANYGLLKMMGENIYSGTWEWLANAKLIPTARRGYALGCWQQLWSYVAMVNNQIYDNTIPYSYTYADGTIGLLYSRQTLFAFDNTTLSALFDPIQDGEYFPLGQKLSWVYDSCTHGWANLNNPSSVSPLPAPVRTKAPSVHVMPTMTRDTVTGDVVVTIRAVNRGALPAANARLTGVQLGGKNAPPSVRGQVHLLRNHFPQTFTVRFAGLAKGMKTVLDIKGVYKGGTFGTKLRVTIP